MTSLFTNVPIKDVLNCLPRVLGGKVDNIPTKIITEQISSCVENSSFACDERFYTQKFGLAMGNHLFLVLANIYMKYLENQLSSTIKDQYTVWRRYADNILRFWFNFHTIDNFLRS